MATITQDTLDWYGWDEDGAGVHDVIGTRCDPILTFCSNNGRYHSEKSLRTPILCLKGRPAGIVGNIQVSEGQEVKSTVPLLCIRPQGSELEKEFALAVLALSKAGHK
jgi:hypothetical protein